MINKMILVCENCGSDDVIEKIWASINDTINKEGVYYQKYNGEVEADVWCNGCNMETKITEQKDFNKENK